MLRKISDAVFVILFLLSAAVQYNDPDPWLWVTIYLAPAAITALAFFNRMFVYPSALGCVAAVAFSIWLFPGTPGRFIDVEEVRESLGLLIVGTWLAWLTVRAASKRGIESDEEWKDA